MQYTSLNEFLADWAFESSATHKIIDNLTDESLVEAASPRSRTLGKLGWHITESIGEMMGRTGLKVFTPDMNQYDPLSASDLKECYKHASESLLEKIKQNWNDSWLDIEDDMYGERWKRGTTLAILIAHQTHHRGQMTILMRKAGLKVPGVYGPAKEEWESMGLEPQE